jgi:hypothetical protein
VADADVREVADQRAIPARHGEGHAAVADAHRQREHEPPGASETSGYGLRSAVVDWTGVSGPLNPTWVEWLMGWPLGWTDLEPLATAKYPSAPPPRGGCSVQATIPEIPCAA